MHRNRPLALTSIVQCGSANRLKGSGNELGLKAFLSGGWTNFLVGQSLGSCALEHVTHFHFQI
jgi:hypothetical protein